MAAITSTTTRAPPTTNPTITPVGNVEEGVFFLEGNVFVPVGGIVLVRDDCR